VVEVVEIQLTVVVEVLEVIGLLVLDLHLYEEIHYF
jgi:hypothetical protein|tara:strand:+ start:92 stop:199 length:108 start_codon:yes stop_codon:yes gene_type:complete